MLCARITQLKLDRFLRVENRTSCAPRLLLCDGKRNGFLRVTRYRVEAASCPLLLGLLDALRPGGHKIPPDVTRASHRSAAKEHELGVGRCPYPDGVSASQHQKLTWPEHVTGHLDLTRNRVERAFLVRRVNRQL